MNKSHDLGVACFPGDDRLFSDHINIIERLIRQPANVSLITPESVAVAKLNTSLIVSDIHSVSPMITDARWWRGCETWQLRHNDEPPASHTYSRKLKKNKMRKNRSK